MAYSYVYFDGDGVTSQFSFNFPYLDKSHISVLVNGLSVPFSFIGDYIVSTATAPGAGSRVMVRRLTPKQKPPVDFEDESVLLERDLNLLAKFNLYVAQETEDYAGLGMILDTDGNWDANNGRVKNLSTPVNPKDAATKAYVDAANGGAAAAEAQGYANDAKATLSDFQRRYLGAKSFPPTLDNESRPLQTGALYYDIGGKKMNVWNGTSWDAAYPTATVTTSVVLATANQTVVATPPYKPGTSNLAVYLNGLRMGLGVDYTESVSGTFITFKKALNAGSEVLLEVIQAAIAGGGSTATGLKIAVLGDSLSAPQKLLSTAWPRLLQNAMHDMGIPCTVYNLAIGGHTYYRANTVKTQGDMTQREYAISLKPDIVIVPCGVNDTVTNVDGRSLETVKADALDFFTKLRTDLPTATILYVSERMFDVTNISDPAQCLNRHVIPYLFNKDQTGSNTYLTGTYNTDMLPNPISADNKTRLANWVALDTYIKSLPAVSASTYLDYWRISRLGGTNTDGLHQTAIAQILSGGYIWNGLRRLSNAAALFPNVVPYDKQVDIWNDPDVLFDAFLVKSGSGASSYYTTRYLTNSDFVSKHWGPFRVLNPDTWFYPSKAQFAFAPGSGIFDPSSTVTFAAHNAQPNQPVQVSVNGGAFGAVSGTTFYTDASGFFLSSTPFLNLQLAESTTYNFRYKIGDEVFGPFAFSTGTDTRPFLEATLTTSQSIVVNNYTTVKYNSVQVDKGANYNPSTGVVTINKPGLYQIEATGWIDSLSPYGQIFLQLFVFGFAGKSGGACNNGGSSGPAGVDLSATKRLGAGAFFDVRMFHTGSGSPSLLGNGTACTLSVNYIGP